MEKSAHLLLSLDTHETYRLPSPSLGARNSKLLTLQHYAGRPPSTEPELLQKLLFYVRQGLRGVGADPSSPDYLDERLDVFRRAFGHFINAWSSYAPLLLAVQEAYEDALASARAGATGVEEVTARLSLMQEETKQLLAHIQQDAAHERDGMASLLDEGKEQLRTASKEADKLRAEVRALTNKLNHALNKKEETELRVVDLAKQLEEMQTAKVDSDRAAQGGEQDMALLRN